MAETGQKLFLGNEPISLIQNNKFAYINPFYEEEPTPISYGGSVTVGTSKYFNVPTDSRFAFGTDDFTVEAFVKFTSGASTNREIMNWDNDGGFGWGYNSSNQLLCYQAGVGAVFFTTTLNIDTWYHVAFSRSSGSMRCFVNGTQVGSTQTFTNNFTAPAGNMIIGKGRTITWPGKFTNFRITKGVALYTSTFTAPTSPLSYDANTSLLLLASTEDDLTVDSTGLNTISNQGATYSVETPFSATP